MNKLATFTLVTVFSLIAACSSGTQSQQTTSVIPSAPAAQPATGTKNNEVLGEAIPGTGIVVQGKLNNGIVTPQNIGCNLQGESFVIDGTAYRYLRIGEIANIAKYDEGKSQWYLDFPQGAFKYNWGNSGSKMYLLTSNKAKTRDELRKSKYIDIIVDENDNSYLVDIYRSPTIDDDLRPKGEYCLSAVIWGYAMHSALQKQGSTFKPAKVEISATGTSSPAGQSSGTAGQASGAGNSSAPAGQVGTPSQAVTPSVLVDTLPLLRQVIKVGDKDRFDQVTTFMAGKVIATDSCKSSKDDIVAVAGDGSYHAKKIGDAIVTCKGGEKGQANIYTLKVSVSK